MICIVEKLILWTYIENDISKADFEWLYELMFNDVKIGLNSLCTHYFSRCDNFSLNHLQSTAAQYIIF
jgi:hypothetical protein